MAYRVMGPRYDLDEVVYLFVMNDPGDHYYKLRPRGKPSAEISNDGMGFTVRNPEKQLEPPSRRIQRFVYGKLMVARLIRTRLAVVRAKRQIPNKSAVPSMWPPALREEAELLTRRILERFRDEVVRDGRRFSILYVPRGHGDVKGILAPEDSWLPWLSQTCADLGIRLLDPRGLLRAHHAAGTAIYDDHWTPAGHELIASFLASALADTLGAELTGKTISRAPLPATQ
ncbi:MAG: hypothetical protein M3O61_12940 [Gemmatimonadota bacterium]|nr:hypothetical protein [Gemmatimonadota bacterium]